MELKEKIEEFLISSGDRQVLYEHEIKGFLRGLGISVPRGVFVPAGMPLPKDIDRLTRPLAAKAVLARGGSKSEVGGVRLSITDGEELRQAVAELSLLDRSEGVLVEEMIAPGFEVIVGGTLDAEFGPIVMFGLGGFLVELFQEISFALAPVGERGALWLIEETKAEKILRGYRGRPPLDTEALVRIIVAVSELIASGHFREIELNPVALYPRGAVALDAKMIRK